MEPYGNLTYNKGMDMKKKLDSAYNPDKQARKEKVVIALSGGLDSYVMAYLLKIQKYELIAVTVQNTWEDYSGDPEKVLSCHITPVKIDAIKEFTNKLGIPLHIIKSAGEFKDLVIDQWISDKISGRYSKACLNCSDLRLHLVHAKMIEVGAKKMATGHYAKLFQHESHKSVFVHTSNDEDHDQSALLSRLPHEILSSLVLPLSDLTKKEVLKLGENFGLVGEERKVLMNDCFPDTPENISFLEKKIPKKFQQEGEITSGDGMMNYGTHTGIFRYSIGEEIEIKEGGKTHKALVGNYVWNEKRILAVDKDFFERDKVLLRNCHLSEEVSFAEPVKGYLQVRDKVVECWIYPKSNSSFYLELPEKIRLINGENVTVLKKKGRNSKVFFTGDVFLLPVEDLPEGENNVQKTIPHIDY